MGRFPKLGTSLSRDFRNSYNTGTDQVDIDLDTALTTANTAKQTADESISTAETVRSEFDRVVAEAGENNPEVVQARGTAVNLNARLDGVDAQMAQTPKFPILSGEVGVTNKAIEYGNVMRYGAVGDGVTDDSPAFQNAINSAYAIKCAVRVPSLFKFYIENTLEVEYWRPLDIVGDSYGVNNASTDNYCNIFCTCDFIKRKDDGNADKRAAVNLRYLNICFYDSLETKNTNTSYAVFNGVTLRNARIENNNFYGLGYFLYNGSLKFVVQVDKNRFMSVNKAFICTYDRNNVPSVSDNHYLSDSYITQNYINGNPPMNPILFIGVSDPESDNVFENNYIDYFMYLTTNDMAFSSGYYPIGKWIKNTLSSFFRITDKKIMGVFENNNFENWNRSMLDSKFTNQTPFMQSAKVGAFIVDPLDLQLDSAYVVNFIFTKVIDNKLSLMDHFIFMVGAPSTSISYLKEFYERGTISLDATAPQNDMVYYRPYNGGSRNTLFNTKVESKNHAISSDLPGTVVKTFVYDDGNTYSYFDAYESMYKWFSDGLYIAHYDGTNYLWYKVSN